jgi:UDP-N-acetyl-D-mannosaminuronate dehydrogenase
MKVGMPNLSSARIGIISLGYVGLPETRASVDELRATIGFAPATPIEKWVARFVE